MGPDALSLWNTSRVPHFNIFHQHGTNSSGGVCVAIGKQLKGTRIEINVENTVIIDVNGFSETIRVIAFYWPVGQIMMLDDLEPYIIENIIITGDFNPSIIEEFWINEQNRGMEAGEWYMNYVRFLAALKVRLTQWKEKEKFRPSLPSYLIQKLKEAKRIRNKYYREKTIFNINEETRVLLQQFKAQNADMSDPHENQIETEYLELMNKLQILNEKIENMNLTEIEKHILKLKSKKSSGFDAVSNFIIKRIPPGYIGCLVNCFNTWLNEHRYPDVWKLAKIVTLKKLKAGIPRCDQTRPISLLATHSKLFEKI
ncbi:unnamed protein product, partial [Rotaria magnacalcarata]